MGAVLSPTLHFRCGAQGHRSCHCKAKIHGLAFWSCDEAGPRKRASGRSWHKPCWSTRRSSVSNLLGVNIGQVLWSSDIAWFWVTKAKQYAWLVRSLTKGILEGTCLNPHTLFQQQKSYLPPHYVPISPEGPQWGQGTPSSWREEVLPGSPHLFESPLGCANQPKTCPGMKP